jgi:hypothetical protein
MKEGGAHDEWRQFPLWARGPAKVIGDEVVLDEDRAEDYPMELTADSNDLVLQLARMAADWDNRDSRDIVTFVRRNGLLWHGARDLGTGGCRESLSEWWEEARLIAVLLSLYNELTKVAANKQAPLLRDALAELVSFYGVDVDAGDQDSDRELAEAGSLYLAEVLTERQESCDVGVTSSLGLALKIREPDYFLRAINPPDLLTAAYVALSDIIVNHAPMKECPGCGRMFVQESGKQKYCTKSCASTSRWRRWKASQDIDA